MYFHRSFPTDIQNPSEFRCTKIDKDIYNGRVYVTHIVPIFNTCSTVIHKKCTCVV